jgi:hypothetical protein
VSDVSTLSAVIFLRALWRVDRPADGERVENSVTAEARCFSGERAEKSIVGIGLEVGMPVFRAYVLGFVGS